jgi:hypothetical protein
MGTATAVNTADWVIGAVLLVGFLAWVSPGFREFLTPGAWQAPEREGKARRRARERTARLRDRLEREHFRVRVPLIGAQPYTEDYVRTAFESVMPDDRTLEVRREDAETTAEFDVMTEDPVVAVRIADRITQGAGFIPGASYVVLA